jgi:hypothetical protein
MADPWRAVPLPATVGAVDDLADHRVVAAGLEFPEGPVAMRDGSVVLVECKRGTLSLVSPDVLSPW